MENLKERNSLLKNAKSKTKKSMFLFLTITSSLFFLCAIKKELLTKLFSLLHICLSCVLCGKSGNEFLSLGEVISEKNV